MFKLSSDKDERIKFAFAFPFAQSKYIPVNDGTADPNVNHVKNIPCMNSEKES